MAAATLTVSDEVKGELKRFSWINWSDVVREETLKQATKMELLNRLEELTKNSKLTDEDIFTMIKKSRKGRFAELKSKGLL